MFKKFDPSTDVSTSTQVKASVQRGIKSSLITTNPSFDDEAIQTLDALLPKKSPLVQYKVGPHLLLYCRPKIEDEKEDVHESINHEPSLFQFRDGPVLPTLKLVHYYPSLKFQSVTVDQGAIPFVIGGANIMCPGLTNPGGSLHGTSDEEDDSGGLAKGDPVVVYAEGKVYAMAVGTMLMSSSDIRKKNKGIAIEVAHYLGDGLFHTDDVS